jgi:choice-of-anchor B domain-containing protein
MALKGRGRSVCGFVIAVIVRSALAVPPGMTEQQRLSYGDVDAPSAAANTAGGVGVALMGQVAPQAFSTNSACTVSATNVCANDIWSYVSPSGREYAILGLRTGTGFVDVTDPYNPVVVGAITDATSVWSDMKTYSTYAYNVNEAGGGMQIINLSQIDPPTRTVSLTGSLTQNGLQRSHTLYLNEASGFAYLSGSNLGSGRLVAVNVINPAMPQIAGQMLEAVYVHAAQIVTYTSGVYAGQEIAFCYCGGQGLKIVNVTSKSNMYTMSTLAYPTLAYCHQGELTSDQRHVVIDDELDESQGLVPTTTTYVVNVEDLSNPYLVTSFTNGMLAIDHNQMVRGDFTYQANYTTGLRVYDISDVENAFEVGSYDTYPYNNGRSFNGAWGVTSRLPSGTVLLSDMHAGLAILDVSEAVGTSCTAPAPPQVSASYVARNRYLTVDPPVEAEYTALRVTVIDVPPPWEALEGTRFWVDRPETVQVLHEGTLAVSALRCTPIYFDFGSVGTLHVADEAIMPGGAYAVEAIRTLCARSNAAHYSAAAMMSTGALWGDVVGSDEDAPDGQVDAIDVVGLVNKFRGVPGAPSLPQTDLHPGRPNRLVDALDIAVAVDAFKGFAYPFAPPSPCP